MQLRFSAILSVLFILRLASAFAHSTNDSLLTVYKNEHNEKQKTLLLLKISEPLFTTNIDSALLICKLAKQQAEKLNNDSLLLACYMSLVVAYNNKPYAEDSALAYIPFIEKLINENNFPVLSYSAYGKIANVYTQLHQYDNGIKYYQRTVDVAVLIGEPTKICGAKSMLGEIYRKSGLLDQAMEIFKEVVTLAEKNNDLGNTIGGYRGIAICYDINKDFANSSKYFKISLDNALKDKNDRTAYSPYGNYGVALWHLKKYDEAIATFDKAVLLGKKHNLKGLQTDYKNLADVYKDKGDLDSSIYFGNLSLALVEKNNEKLLQTIVHAILADAYKLKGDYKSAYEHLQRGGEINGSLKIKENEKAIAAAEAVYQNKEKKTKIELLSKENAIKALTLQQKEIALREAGIKSSQKETEIALLNKNKEVQELTLNNTQQKLSRKELEAKTQNAEIELMQKNKLINESELAQQKFLRNGLLVGLILLMVVGVLLYNRFQLRKKIEHQQVLLNERKRISNELHDDLGSGLSTIRFLSEVAKAQAKDVHSKNQLEKISDVSNDLVDNMKQIVWTLNAEENTLENLILDLKKYVNDYLDTNNLALQLQVPEIFPNCKLSSETRRNIFLVVKECLHNTVKHAEATEVNLDVQINEKVKVVLQDNGKGFNIEQRSNSGNGLSNMRIRMLASNGTFEIQNKVGTTVTLTF